MIVSCACRYVRHVDQAVCAAVVEVDIGGPMNWKELWGRCLAPGHRLFSLEVVSIDGAPFIPEGAGGLDKTMPYRNKEQAKKKRGSK